MEQTVQTSLPIIFPVADSKPVIKRPAKRNRTRLIFSNAPTINLWSHEPQTKIESDKYGFKKEGNGILSHYAKLLGRIGKGLGEFVATVGVYYMMMWIIPQAILGAYGFVVVFTLAACIVQGIKFREVLWQWLKKQMGIKP